MRAVEKADSAWHLSASDHREGVQYLALHPAFPLLYHSESDLTGRITEVNCNVSLQAGRVAAPVT